MKKQNKPFSFLEVSCITIVTSLVMFILGAIIIYNRLGGINYTLLKNDSDLQEFINEYENLVDNYYDELDRAKVIKGAISGMYNAIDDPYTTYLDSKNSENLYVTLNGQYRGIGIKIEKTENIIRIIEVFNDSPAIKSGLKVGDLITSVNDKDVSNMEVDEVASIIKESSDNLVRIDVIRDGLELIFDIDVQNLLVPVVNSEILSKNNLNIGYISLSVFNDTADDQFMSALASLESSGFDSLIIDLRNNNGGYLEAAKNISELFLPKDKTIYSLKNKKTQTSYKDKTDEYKDYKIAVIINKQTASASEILASALKYSYGATLIGQTTYGKGKVQEMATLSDGTIVKYTTSEWLTPNGDCIDGIGLKPDYEIDFNSEQYNIGDIYSDSQILYALEYLVS